MVSNNTKALLCLATLILLSVPAAQSRPSWLFGKKEAAAPPPQSRKFWHFGKKSGSAKKIAHNPTQYKDAYSGGAHSLWGPNSPLLGQMNSGKKTAQYKKHFMKAKKKRFLLF